MGVFSALGAIGGALLGKRSQDKTNRDTARLAREMAQYGIRWKVADAKAAGIHPLFALGSSGSISPTLSSSSDAIASGAAAAGRALDSLRGKGRAKTMHRANVDLIESQIDLNKARQKLAMAESQDISRQGARVPTGHLEEIDMSGFRRRAQAIRDRASVRRGIAWNRAPLLVEATTPGGGRVLIPDQNVVETGEAVGAALTGLYGDITGTPTNVPKSTPKGGHIGPADKPFIRWSKGKPKLVPVKVRAKKRNPYKRGTAKYYRWKNQQRRR